jgi:hypothetical protein
MTDVKSPYRDPGELAPPRKYSLLSGEMLFRQVFYLTVVVVAVMRLWMFTACGDSVRMSIMAGGALFGVLVAAGDIAHHAVARVHNDGWRFRWRSPLIGWDHTVELRRTAKGMYFTADDGTREFCRSYCYSWNKLVTYIRARDFHWIRITRD